MASLLELVTVQLLNAPNEVECYFAGQYRATTHERTIVFVLPSSVKMAGHTEYGVGSCHIES